MEHDEIQAVVIGTLVGTFYGLIMCLVEVNGMDIFLEIVKYLVAALAGSIIMAFVNRKTQINTISRQLGLNDNKTLRTELTEQYEKIIEHIGKGTKESLTNQHEDIKKSIENNYREIKEKYNKEEEAYRCFSIHQRDLKSTLDNFSRDYMRTIHHESELLQRNMELENEKKQLELEIEDLKRTNQELSKQINKLMNFVRKERDERER